VGAIKKIASAEDGHVARLHGKVRFFGNAPLTSPLGERRCVYHEVRDPLKPDEQAEGRGQDFFLEDDSGRAVVIMKRHEVDMTPRMSQELVSLLDASVQAVSTHLHVLKDRYRSSAGDEQRRLSRELNRKKKVATLLCALRAQARGRVHMGKSPEDQAERIARLKEQIESDEELQAADPIPIQRYEVTLEEGEEVTVEGFCQWEPDPDPRAEGASYRERPLRLVVRAPLDGVLRVEGEARAEGARGQPVVKRKDKKARKARRGRPWPKEGKAQARSGRWLLWLAIALVLAVIASRQIFC